MTDKGRVGEDLIVYEQSVPTTMQSVPQKDLRYYVDNPRVYSSLRSDGQTPSQEEIQECLQDMEHVRILIRDIELHGGLIEPLIVRDGSMEVLEGNSRLAAYRFLAGQNAIKWGKVRCRILPEETSDDIIFGLLGQIHVKGKRDWQPFEQAGFLYRRHQVQKIDLDTLCQQMGLSRSKIKQYLEAYQLMLDNNEVKSDRWSYFFEFVRSKKIKKAREGYSGFDDLVIGKIRSGEIERAQDLRDKLPVICATPKTLKKFSAGSVDFADAYDDSLEQGGDDRYYKKLKGFRDWLAREEVATALYSTDGALRSKIEYEMKQLNRRVDTLRKKSAD
jgi:hypothetical protein